MSENLQPRKFGRIQSIPVDTTTIPLDNFEVAYEKLMQAYKTNNDVKPIIKLIRELIKLNKDNLSMQNNKKYFNLYLIIIKSYEKKLDLYQQLDICKLFSKLPEFYLQYALELQTHHQFKKAKDILSIGLNETQSKEIESMLNSIEEEPQMGGLLSRSTKRVKLEHTPDAPMDKGHPLLDQYDKVENKHCGPPLQGQVIAQPKRIAEKYVVPSDHYSILQKEVNDPKLKRMYDFKAIHPISYNYTIKQDRATMKTVEQVKFELFTTKFNKNITTRRTSRTPKQTPPMYTTPIHQSSRSFEHTPVPMKFNTEPTMTFHTKQAMNEVNDMFKPASDVVPVEIGFEKTEELTKQLYANPMTVEKEHEEMDNDLDLEDSFLKRLEEFENKL